MESSLSLPLFHDPHSLPLFLSSQLVLCVQVVKTVSPPLQQTHSHRVMGEAQWGQTQRQTTVTQRRGTVLLEETQVLLLSILLPLCLPPLMFIFSLLQLHHHLKTDILEEKSSLKTLQQNDLDLTMVSMVTAHSLHVCTFSEVLCICSEPALTIILCKDTMILWSSSSLGNGSTTSASSLVGQSTPLGNVYTFINTSLSTDGYFSTRH